MYKWFLCCLHCPASIRTRQSVSVVIFAGADDELEEGEEVDVVLTAPQVTAQEPAAAPASPALPVAAAAQAMETAGFWPTGPSAGEDEDADKEYEASNPIASQEPISAVQPQDPSNANDALGLSPTDAAAADAAAADASAADAPNEQRGRGTRQKIEWKPTPKQPKA